MMFLTFNFIIDKGKKSIYHRFAITCWQEMNTSLPLQNACIASSCLGFRVIPILPAVSMIEMRSLSSVGAGQADSVQQGVTRLAIAFTH